MISTLILLPWDLNEFYLETTNSTLHLLKVLLHSLVLAFVVTINLTSYDLGVAIYDHVFSSRCSCKVQSCH